MSWLFGKKKQKESLPDSAEEISAPSQPEDFFNCGRRGNAFDPNIAPTNGSGGSNKAGGSSLYPYLENVLRNPPPLPTSSSYGEQNILGDTQSYLSAIKFQLNKKFEDNIEIDRIHINEILSYFSQIKNNDYKYDFSLENSVIAEMVAAAK